MAEQHGIDPDAEYNRHHRQRKRPRRIDDQPETAANLSLLDHYRKEFIAVPDVQICALKADTEVVTNILQLAITLLQPPYIGPVDTTQLTRLVNTFPASVWPIEEVLETKLTTFCCHLCENHKETQSVNDALVFLKSLTRRCLLSLSIKHNH